MAGSHLGTQPQLRPTSTSGCRPPVAGGGSVLLLESLRPGWGPADATALSDIIRRLATSWESPSCSIQHNVDMVLRTCDQIVALNFGVTIGHGTPAEIRKNPAVVAAYPGAGRRRGGRRAGSAHGSPGPPSSRENPMTVDTDRAPVLEARQMSPVTAPSRSSRTWTSWCMRGKSWPFSASTGRARRPS